MWMRLGFSALIVAGLTGMRGVADESSPTSDDTAVLVEFLTPVESHEARIKWLIEQLDEKAKAEGLQREAAHLSTELQQIVAGALRPGPAALPPGLDGYCPVTLAEQKQWQRGSPDVVMEHAGRRYFFCGSAAARRFKADPDHYSPVMSGLDIVRLIDDKDAVFGARSHGVFYDGRTYLFADEHSLSEFSREPQRYIAIISATRRD